MDTELKSVRISICLHTGIAIFAGWLSIILVNVLLAGVIGIVLLFCSGYLSEKIVGKRGIKWWLGNGVIIYLFIWLISWTFFLNL